MFSWHPHIVKIIRGCVLVCFGAFSKRTASAMKQPQLRSRPRDADCLVARMVALHQSQCFGPGTLHLRWQSQWTKMLKNEVWLWGLRNINWPKSIQSTKQSIYQSIWLHTHCANQIPLMCLIYFYLPPTTRDPSDPRMNRFNTEPWFQGGYLREGKGFYDRLPEMAASEIIFQMPRKFPIPTARLITYFTPNNHRHWIYNSPRFFDSIYECIITLLFFFNITVKHIKTYRTHIETPCNMHSIRVSRPCHLHRAPRHLTTGHCGQVQSISLGWHYHQAQIHKSSSIHNQ